MIKCKKLIWIDKLKEIKVLTENLFIVPSYANQEINNLIKELLSHIVKLINTYKSNLQISEKEIIDENNKLKLKYDVIVNIYKQQNLSNKNQKLFYEAYINIFNKLFDANYDSIDTITKTKDIIKRNLLTAKLEEIKLKHLNLKDKKALIINSLNQDNKLTPKVSSILNSLIDIGLDFSTEYNTDSSEDAIKEKIMESDYIIFLANSILHNSWYQYINKYSNATSVDISISAYLSALSRLIGTTVINGKIMCLLLESPKKASVPPFFLNKSNVDNIDMIEMYNFNHIIDNYEIIFDFIKEQFINSNNPEVDEYILEMKSSIKEEFDKIDSIKFSQDIEKDLISCNDIINQKIIADNLKLPNLRHNYNSIVFDVGTRNDDFFGRNKYLNQIHELFDSNGQGSKEAKVFVIVGLKGCGKSQIAKEYAWRYKTEYKYIFTIKSSSYDSYIRDTLFKLSNKKIRDKKRGDLFAAFNEYLSGIDDWLIIFDDFVSFKEIEAYLPKNPKNQRGHIIVCVNIANNCKYSIGSINNFENWEAYNYINKCILKDSRLNITKDFTSINNLCSNLNYFPYNLSLAIAYFKSNPKTTIPSYLVKIEKSNLTEEEQAILAQSGNMDNYGLTIYQIVKETITEIQKQQNGLQAIKLLVCIAMIDSDKLEDKIIKEILTDIFSFSDKVIDDLINLLLNYHLLILDGNAYKYHLLTKRLISLAPAIDDVFGLSMIRIIKRLFSQSNEIIDIYAYIDHMYNFLSKKFNYSHTSSAEGKVEYVHHIDAFINSISERSEYYGHSISMLTKLAEFEYFERRRNEIALSYAQKAMDNIKELQKLKPESVDLFIKGLLFIYAAMIGREESIPETKTYFITAFDTLNLAKQSNTISKENKLYLELLVKRFEGQQKSAECKYVEASKLLEEAKIIIRELSNIPNGTYTQLLLEDAFIIGTQARIDFFIGKYLAALASNDVAIGYKKRVRNGDDYEVALNYLSSIEILLKIHDYVKAMDYLNKLEDSIKTSFGEDVSRHSPIIKLALERHKGMYLYAIGELQQAQKCFNTIKDDPKTYYSYRPHAFYYLAKIALHINDTTDEARLYINECTKLFDDIANIRGVNLFEHAEFYKASAEIYLASNFIDKAQKNVTQAEELLDKAIRTNNIDTHPLKIQILFTKIEISLNRNKLHSVKHELDNCEQLLNKIYGSHSEYRYHLDYADFHILRAKEIHSDYTMGNIKHSEYLQTIIKHIEKIENIYNFHFQSNIHKLPNHFRYKNFYKLKSLINPNMRTGDTPMPETNEFDIDSFINAENNAKIIFNTLANKGFTWSTLKKRYLYDPTNDKSKREQNHMLMQKLISKRDKLDETFYENAVQRLFQEPNYTIRYEEVESPKENNSGIKVRYYKFLIFAGEIPKSASSKSHKHFDILIKAPGSRDLTSDIDTTIEINKLDEFLSTDNLTKAAWPHGWNLNNKDLALLVQTAIIYYFNTLNEGEFKISSGENRDSNVYSDGFINPKGYPKFKYLELPIESKIDLKKLYAPYKLVKQQQELAASLVSLYEYFVISKSISEWERFKSELIDDWINQYQNNKQLQQYFIDTFIGNHDNMGIFKRTEDYYKYKSQELAKVTESISKNIVETSSLKGPELEKDIEVRAMNQLYVNHLLLVAAKRFDTDNQMDKISTLLDNLRNNMNLVKSRQKLLNTDEIALNNDSDDEDLKDRLLASRIRLAKTKENINTINMSLLSEFKKLAGLINNQQDEQIKANLFANEAYINRSGPYHIVQWVQSQVNDVKVDKKQVVVGSILQQIGIRLLHAELMQQANRPIGEILYSVSKYGVRVADMLFGNKNEYLGDKVFEESELQSLQFILSRLNIQIPANKLDYSQYTLVNNDARLVKEVKRNNDIHVDQKAPKAEGLFKSWIYRLSKPTQLSISEHDISSIQEAQMKSKLSSDKANWLKLARKAIILTYYSKFENTHHLWGDKLSLDVEQSSSSSKQLKV